MSAHSTAHTFKQNAARAMADAQLVGNLKAVRENFIGKRAKAVAALPEFEALREQGREVKNHTLAHLDLYLEAYSDKVIQAGGQVHFAPDAQSACAQILAICQQAGAKTVTKGKSMVSEEIGINDYLIAKGIEPIETDLGEYIIQLRGERPSHIIAPAVHLNKHQIEADFRRAHTHLDPARDLDEKTALLSEARAVLRSKFLAADVGITGANFLVAETGSAIIVTNEGNGDLTQTLPRVQIVLASIDKLVPTLEDATTLLRLLARSATGQEMSCYTTLSTGPRRVADPDGPTEYHVVLLDNGRSAMIGTPFQDMLRCIRCAACMNHCPVYQQIGGHAYGWIYPGPMGSVLTPSLIGVQESGQLPNASTFCGRCESVCPMKIPLPGMMRHWREREFSRHLNPAMARYGLAFWAFFVKHPWLYALSMRVFAKTMAVLGRASGRFNAASPLRFLPGMGTWLRHRDFAAPEGDTFQARWAAHTRARRAGGTP